VRSVTLTTVDLQVMGDGACEVGHARLTLGNGTTAPAKYVVIWKQEDGGWRWDIDMLEPECVADRRAGLRSGRGGSVQAAARRRR
jgi:ketosteroid isomerase-like protein